MKTKRNAISRRNFLAVSAATIATLATKTTAFAASEDAAAASPGTAAKKYPIGLELYSVRAELARDLPNTLRTVAKMGYEVVEFYAPYSSWTLPYAKEVRTLMDDIGLRCYSTHNNIASFTPGDSMSKAIELNQILGGRHLILASEPGTSLKASGWSKTRETDGDTWNRPGTGRHRVDKHPTGPKTRWEFGERTPAFARWPEGLTNDAQMAMVL